MSTPPAPPDHVAGGHNSAGHRPQLPADDFGDKQLVRGEVVLVVRVVPDVGVPVPLVRRVLGTGRLPNPLLGRVAVPQPVTVEQGRPWNAVMAIDRPLVVPSPSSETGHKLQLS